MRLYRFGAADGRPITEFGSERVAITGILRGAGGDVQIGCMHLEPGGRVGAHAATTGQLFLVVSGEGWVRGPAPERTAIMADQAAFWETGEEHESGSDTGMVALVIEGDTLDPRSAPAGAEARKPERRMTPVQTLACRNRARRA